MKSMYATFLLAVNVWTELKQQIYWLIQQNQIREFDMHMIKWTRNEFCFEYINTYIKNELFVKIELLTGKKIPWHHIVIKVWKFRKKLFKGITLTYNLWIRNQDHDHWIFLSNKQFLCWINGKKSKQKKRPQQGFTHKSVTWPCHSTEQIQDYWKPIQFNQSFGKVWTRRMK